MKVLSDVSETALITLKSRAVESLKPNAVINDPKSMQILESMKVLADSALKTKLEKPLPSTLTRHIALRARKYDADTLEFIQKHPRPLVVNLGCGFDTRYWRIQTNRDWQYVEVDLPNVIETKHEILAGELPFRTIGGSVLEDEWLQEIVKMQTKNVLFLAEGLFMYLPQKEVEALFKKLALNFSQSLIVFETVIQKYTQGIWKKMVEMKMKNSADSTAGSSYQFGLQQAQDIELLSDQIKVIKEWSYFEDPDIEPKLLYAFRNWKFFTRTQWTITAALGKQ